MDLPCELWGLISQFVTSWKAWLQVCKLFNSFGTDLMRNLKYDKAASFLRWEILHDYHTLKKLKAKGSDVSICDVKLYKMKDLYRSLSGVTLLPKVKLMGLRGGEETLKVVRCLDSFDPSSMCFGGLMSYIKTQKASNYKLLISSLEDWDYTLCDLGYTLGLKEDFDYSIKPSRICDSSSFKSGMFEGILASKYLNLIKLIRGEQWITWFVSAIEKVRPITGPEMSYILGHLYDFDREFTIQKAKFTDEALEVLHQRGLLPQIFNNQNVTWEQIKRYNPSLTEHGCAAMFRLSVPFGPLKEHILECQLYGLSIEKFHYSIIGNTRLSFKETEELIKLIDPNYMST